MSPQQGPADYEVMVTTSFIIPARLLTAVRVEAALAGVSATQFYLAAIRRELDVRGHGPVVGNLIAEKATA
jgi:hypothetical protein